MPDGDSVLARIAGNLGLRLGVVGAAAPLPAEPPDALLQADGSTVAALAHLGLAATPRDLLATLARDLATEGRPLRPGASVALLAAPAPMAPRSGETWRFSAGGLGTVSVTFR
jgi:2-keto-4-pentenoate hydratase